MEWLKTNWFKVASLLVVFIGLISIGAFYYASELSKQASIEELQRAELQLKKEQVDAENIRKQQETKKAEAEALQEELTEKWVNDCITDAYTEMQTLQGNYFEAAKVFCAKYMDSCSETMENYKENEKKAFQTYQNEWVPQCKLGNRVFLDYEPYTFTSVP